MKIIVVGAGIGVPDCPRSISRARATTSPCWSALRRRAGRCASFRSTGAAIDAGPTVADDALGVRRAVRRRRDLAGRASCAGPGRHSRAPRLERDRAARSVRRPRALLRRDRPPSRGSARPTATAPSPGARKTCSRRWTGGSSARSGRGSTSSSLPMASPGSAACARSARSTSCGRRSASISPIRVCVSSSAATPPIAARRRSLAPATLMLVAHVERAGVWYPQGGMHALPQAVARLAVAKGAVLRYDAHVDGIDTAGSAVSGVTLASGERLACDGRRAQRRRCSVDDRAVRPRADGRCAEDRAWRPFALGRYLRDCTRRRRASRWCATTLFFSRDYNAEFDAILARDRTPDEPTVYVCAQDRGDDESSDGKPERLPLPRQRPGQRRCPRVPA